ncbi:MAG: hypothetical protein JWN31_12, partial [Frankiales bacterium]|nr:hypothetical protein [Frankiales bacterium]
MTQADLRLAPPAVAAWLVAWQGRLLPPRLLLAVAVVLGGAAAALVLAGRMQALQAPGIGR